MRLFSLLAISFALSGIGLAAVLLSRATDSESLLKLGALCIILGAVGIALDIIRKREEPVSAGDSWFIGYIHGTQAVLSGLGYLLLALCALAAILAWILGQGMEFLDWVKVNSGLIPLLVGIWLVCNYLGVILGQAISMVVAISETKVDGAIIIVNAAIEKLISLILTCVGLVLMIVGIAALISGKGALELVLGWL